MQRHFLSFRVLAGRYGVARLDGRAPLPTWAEGSGFLSLTRTSEELSVVCQQERIPETVVVEKGWRILKIEAVLDFGLVGILASISKVLAEAGISIFVLSTFDTDYILVKEELLGNAVTALELEGHRVGVEESG